MPGSTPVRTHYIPTLDGWRAFAIAGVLLCHSFASTYWSMSGALGVNLFFAISGYLITARLLAEHRSTGAFSLQNFYLRRAFRILPPALIYLAVVAILAALGVVEASRTDIVSCLVFLRNYWGAAPFHGWYTGHFWSLAVEEQFYVFWPLLLLFSGPKRARWVAPALAISFAVWRSVDMRHAWMADLFHNEALRNGSLRSDYRMDAILWGCTLAILTQTRDLKKLVSLKTSSWLAIAALVAAVALNVFQPKGYMIAQALLFPIAVIATVAQPQAWLSRILESSPLQRIGRLSYSLYLWQQLFFHSGYHHALLQRFPLNLALALACAWLSYRYVERPAIVFGRKLMQSRRVSNVIAAAA
jgi:peptidoglycan/LPS O-acetylase OafA/YrhL